jgi:hypothetical protein
MVGCLLTKLRHAEDEFRPQWLNQLGLNRELAAFLRSWMRFLQRYNANINYQRGFTAVTLKGGETSTTWYATSSATSTGARSHPAEDMEDAEQPSWTYCTMIAFAG